ncbi:hypothetical protein C8J57DRAFT_671455 [Mycena rebaudengoi]|nr:hypothetical protein C8J57DRAFT_671455 [Mycena rebaudengoi]
MCRLKVNWESVLDIWAFLLTISSAADMEWQNCREYFVTSSWGQDDSKHQASAKSCLLPSKTTDSLKGPPSFISIAILRVWFRGDINDHTAIDVEFFI